MNSQTTETQTIYLNTVDMQQSQKR